MTNNDNSGPVLRNLSSQTSEDYEIKKILKRLLSYWYWFLICIILAVSIAYVYNRYATPYMKSPAACYWKWETQILH